MTGETATKELSTQLKKLGPYSYTKKYHKCHNSKCLDPEAKTQTKTLNLIYIFQSQYLYYDMT